MGRMTTVGEIRALLETAWPPSLAESWDKVGLICGDPADEVTTVAVALEANEASVAAALEVGAQMLVVHHPLLLRGTSSVAADDPKGALIHQLIRGGCALYAAHTNADAAHGGVNDVLAELLGVINTRPLDPVEDSSIDHWGVHVPGEALAAVKDAVFSAGAGAIGEYSECCYVLQGEGQFRPSAAAQPAVGRAGVVEKVSEARVEFVAPRGRRHAIAAAVRAAHPYEEPAFDIAPLQMPRYIDGHAVGIGRVGELDEPMTLQAFAARVADRLPETVWGVRAAGDPNAVIRTVALCSGAGDSFLGKVGRSVDCYVTSDLRHHPVDEHLRAGGCAVIDTAHWASESPWCSSVAALLPAQVRTVVVDRRSDPWTVSVRKGETVISGSDGSITSLATVPGSHPDTRTTSAE